MKKCHRALWVYLLLTAFLGFDGLAHGYTPGVGTPSATSGFGVNNLDRRDVLVFHNVVYKASENFASNMAWTGDVTTGVPGTTSAAFKNDVLRRINYYRALSGLPGDIVFNATKSSKCQEAALMFSANNSISHTPPVNWTWYTANASEAAANANISIGNYGPSSINAFMVDSGSGNMPVGHRRWLLYSRAQEMGTGDVPASNGKPASNAVWVLGNYKAAPTPSFVAWPNRGFVPRSVVPARWSLSYPNANFGSATVTMTQGGSPLSTTVISRTDNGYGDNTIVWEPTGIPSSLTNDVTCNITVSGISGTGVPTSYNYQVTIFNPDILGESVTISGTNTPTTTGQAYAFNSITQADSYELKISQGSATLWTEGAEDSPVPQITDQTSGPYTLRQTALKRTGAKAFQLTFPDSSNLNDQSFIITRDVMPSASSALEWYDRGRFATTNTTLGAQVSNDNGMTWTSVFSRPGVGLSSVLWDPNFISRSISLASYAGQVIKIRFVMSRNGGSYTSGATENYGFFIDDITITNATELINSTTTTLNSAATGFTLNATTAGSPLIADTSYFMQVRPSVGLQWYGFGALKTVTAQAPSGYATWISTNYPAVTGGITGDHDGDGILNGVEYAFGLNPTAPTSHSLLPAPVRSGGNMTLSYAQPGSVTGVSYQAQYSYNLVNWFPMTDAGVGLNHLFSISTVGQPKMFIRHAPVITP